MTRRLLGAAAVLVVSLLVLEGALQLAAVAVPRVLSRATQPSKGDFRLLCVGDSHTYGSGAAALESYPRLLQEELARRYPGMTFEAMNLGVPGMNSSQVANRIESQIYEFRPDLVIVWVGLNNPWNATEVPGRNALRRVLMMSRLVRLAVVAWEKGPPPSLTREQRQVDRTVAREPFTRHAVELSWSEALSTLEMDLERIARAIRRHRLPWILLNYPYALKPELRAALQAAGERLGVPVVDTAVDARRAEADGVHPIFVWGAGYHPTATLNRYIAASVADAAEQAMRLDRSDSELPPGAENDSTGA